ncbi:MAG: glutathione synthase [Burkholderiaceae bacterium]
MQILIILDPLASIKTYKDTTYAMMQSALGRGHSLCVCGIGDLTYDSVGAGGAGLVVAKAQSLVIDADADPWYRTGDAKTMPLNGFDAVLMRTDPPFDMEYVYATYMFDRAQEQGARVFNRGRAIRDHNEKFAIAEFPHLTAPTLITRDPARLREFVMQHGRSIFKLLDGMGGMSIFQALPDDPNLSVIIETMNLFGRQSVMAQKFLPEIAAGDKRILLIGGQVVPHALARIPASGEVRGNMAAGGRPVAQPLSARDLEIANELAPELNARGLFLVGLDVIGDRVTEINVTSPTGFQEITAQTGFDVAGLFIEQLERAVAGT